MASKYEKGMDGQQIAEAFLIGKGYVVKDKNYRLRSGEIDLVVAHRGYVIFVEVKYRRGLTHGYPREAVTYGKQQKIQKTALHYVYTRGLGDADMRFDVVEVLEMNGEVMVNHIENAFP